MFLDPDANHDVLLEVMKGFNGVFEKANLDFYFQPLQSPENLPESSKMSYSIISSSYEALWRHLHLQPILVPEANGSIYYRKALVSQSDLPKDLSGQVIAAAVEQQRADEVKAVLTKHGYDASSAYVLAVGKDIDAMLAVSFGEATAALVTQESLGVLKQVNPSVAARLRTLLTTEPQLRAPLCRPKHIPSDSPTGQRLVEAFIHLSDTPEGQQILQLMSIARWVPYGTTNTVGAK